METFSRFAGAAGFSPAGALVGAGSAMAKDSSTGAVFAAFFAAFFAVFTALAFGAGASSSWKTACTGAGAGAASTDLAAFLAVVFLAAVFFAAVFLAAAFFAAFLAGLAASEGISAADS